MAEQLPLKQFVVGSNPTEPSIKIFLKGGKLKRIHWIITTLTLMVLLLVLGLPFDAKAGFKQLLPLENNGEQNHFIMIQYKAASKICTITTNDQVNQFVWTGWKMRSGITDYYINYNTIPANISRDTVKTVFDMSFSNIQGAGGGVLFHYAGETSKSVASNDSVNTLFFAPLTPKVVAVTYVWLDNNNLMTNVDTVFNNQHSWANTGYNGENDCSGAKGYYDLRNVATHEFGHWIGLGDMYHNEAKDLTMYGYANIGELKKDNLGLGDITGVRSVWP